jgi:hypothetical protein
LFTLSQSPWNAGRTGLINNIFTRKDGEQEKEQQSLLRTYHLPGNSDVLIQTRLLPSSDDSHNNFSGTLP